MGRNVGELVVGGAIAYAALLALLTAIFLALSQVMPSWGAALVVFGLTGIVAAALISKAAAALKRTDPAPRRTVETLKENAQWAKQQAK